MKFFTIILLLFILINFVKCQSDNCYQSTKNPFSFFATKTAYSSVSSKNITQQHCKTLQLWMLSRHGTRNPSANIINKISNLTIYKNKITKNSTLCEEDIQAIKAWKFNLTENDNNKLNSQGIEDLSSLGFRLKNVYADIFNEPYSPVKFNVLSSTKSRCVDTAFHFLQSAFNTNITVPLMNRDDKRLNISQFKKNNNDDDKNKSKLKEVMAFNHGIHIQQLVHRVSKILGLDNNLTLGTVKTMYESCRFEKSWHANSHPAWCAVFSQNDLEILEYEEDLKYYYLIGYGDSYNERIGCPIVKDLITNFRQKSRTQIGPNGIFYFGHSSNVLSTIVRLGFAKDTSPLLSTNFKEKHNRKWKTSYLSPFASNVIAVLYDCNGVKKVSFFVNEVAMVVEKYNCTLCPWKLIYDMFDPIISSPSCMVDKTSSASDVSETIVILFITCLFNILKYLY